MGLGQLECRGDQGRQSQCSPPGSQEYYVHPVGTVACVEAEKVVSPTPPPTGTPRGLGLCQSSWPYADMQGPQVITVGAASLVPCLCTYMRSPAGDWPCVWQPLTCMPADLHPSGQQMQGEGRVLAHTTKQHHELLLPAYLKIATAEETRPHRALGEG